MTAFISSGHFAKLKIMRQVENSKSHSGPRCTLRQFSNLDCTSHTLQRPHAAFFLGLFAPLLVAGSVPASVQAVVSHDLCIAGEGPGCDSLAADSPLIRKLQEKSKENKDKNTRETLEKYWNEGYQSYFSYGYDKVLKKDSKTGAWYLGEPDDVFAPVRRRMGLFGLERSVK